MSSEQGPEDFQSGVAVGVVGTLGIVAIIFLILWVNGPPQDRTRPLPQTMPSPFEPQVHGYLEQINARGYGFYRDYHGSEWMYNVEHDQMIEAKKGHKVRCP